MTETIAHITDIHLDEDFPKQRGVNARAQWEMMIGDLQKRGIQKVIFGGDIGDPGAVPYFFESLKSFELNISPGNHDVSLDGKVPHLAPKPGKDGYYRFNDDGAYRFIFMDSSLQRISEAQLAWFKEALVTDLKIILAMKIKR